VNPAKGAHKRIAQRPARPDMPERLKPLLNYNRQWAASMEQHSPGFFTRLAQQQNPRDMWIGCADSRVPANEITGLEDRKFKGTFFSQRPPAMLLNIH